ncbi:MAG TPA: hypothetical protein VMJ72_02385 [Candidatus Paceibacterota bacterium]|nr:hypothetical protein [Candidatus Paceibacterota bacterium]
MHVKRISLIVAVVVVSMLTWWAAHAWLTVFSPFTDYVGMIWPAVMMIVLAAVVGIAWLLLEHPLDRVAAILASWATFVIFFSPDIWYLSVLPVFVGFWYVGSRRIRHDIMDHTKIRVWSGLDRGVRLVLLGVYLMISLGFFLLPIGRTADVNLISQGIQGTVQSTYNSDLVKSQLTQLPPALQAQVKSELTTQIDTQIHQWLGPVAPYLPPLLAFGFFLILWGFSFIFRELGLALAVPLFAVLKKTGFVTVGEKDVKADVVTL